MKHVLVVKLDPTTEQATLLKATLETCNSACDGISAWVYTYKKYNKRRIQQHIYHKVKQHYSLGAQAVVRCIAKVADAYRAGNRETLRTFRPLASQPYDSRLLRFIGQEVVSLWTLKGRIKVPLRMGNFQRRRFHFRKGEVDLAFRRGKWYLHVTCEVPECPLHQPDDFLGVDLGIVNLACDSDGIVFSGAKVDRVRRRYAHRRRNLQRKGTRAATRKLRELSGREARFRKDVNHRISKVIVWKAKRTDRGIALEDLKGIRDRVTARRRQRARLHSWAFYQLRFFVEYKAKRLGVLTVAVDPRNTSRMCPVCGHCEKRNRRTRDQF